MANMIPIGMPINGKTRRFATLPKGRFLYSCPNCTGIVSNDQAWCVCGEDLGRVTSLYIGKEEK